MRRYDTAGFTFGVELEYADVRFGNPLPKGCAWNTKDNTIVNSNGIANDPAGKLWLFGGEINTRPTDTPEEQAALVSEVIAMLEPKPVINYRDNLHVHVRVPGLCDDLEACKRLLSYVTGFAGEAFALVEPIPDPVRADYPDEEAHEGAWKRCRRRHKSHQHMLPAARVHEMMMATTTRGFFEGHAALGKDGKRAWFFSPRAGINLRQMWEATGTIEFRHFPGTLSEEEMFSCVEWCRLFLDAALNTGERPSAIFERNKGRLRFPHFETYQHELEKRYRLTNHDSNTRAQVKAALRKLAATDSGVRRLAPASIWE